MLLLVSLTLKINEISALSIVPKLSGEYPSAAVAERHHKPFSWRQLWDLKRPKSPLKITTIRNPQQ
jgi:hypothetical protein